MVHGVHCSFFFDSPHPRKLSGRDAIARFRNRLDSAESLPETVIDLYALASRISFLN